MSRFAYLAVKDGGERIAGTLRSTSISEAARKLLELGYHPVSIQQERDVNGFSRQVTADLFRRVGTSDLAVFTRQLASLLNAGLPMMSALNTLRRQCSNRRLARVIEDMEETLSHDAAGLSEAMERHAAIFNPVYRGLVRSGEESGNLVEVLNKLSRHLTQSAKLRGQVIGAFIYPIFLIVLGVGAVIVLMTLVVPKFQDLFASFGQQLPWLTRALIVTSTFLSTWWWALILALLVIIVGFFLGIRRSAFRQLVEQMLFRMPVVGSVLLKVETARISHTLATLLNSGIRILEALRITGDTAQTLTIRNTFGTIVSAVSAGEGLAPAMERAAVYPPLMVSLIRTGEETGELPEMLAELAAIYEEESERSVTAAVKLLEPVLIVIMGGIIGGIVAAVILPIFRANVIVSQ